VTASGICELRHPSYLAPQSPLETEPRLMENPLTWTIQPSQSGGLRLPTRR